MLAELNENPIVNPPIINFLAPPPQKIILTIRADYDDVDLRAVKATSGTQGDVTETVSGLNVTSHA